MSGEVRTLLYQIPHAGVARTGDQIRSVIIMLEASLPVPEIFYCLRDAGDPLAAADVEPKQRWWWAFAEEEEKQHGLPAVLEQYQGRKHPPRTKCLVIAGLNRMILGDGDRQVADTGDQAYKPPPQGKEIAKSKVFATDPDKMDRGTAAHKDTQNALAEALLQAGLTPRSPRQDLGDPAFDVAWRDGGVAFIAEVKSLTDENETAQIRLAIGQVLDYVHTLHLRRKTHSLPPHWKGVSTVQGVIAVEHQPVGAPHWAGVCEENGIILTWPSKYSDMLLGA
jgi:hypothetical protein